MGGGLLVELGGEGDGAAAGEKVAHLVVGLVSEKVEDPVGPRVGLGADVVVPVADPGVEDVADGRAGSVT